MSNTSVRMPTLAMLAVLLSVNAGLALPVPPETVVASHSPRRGIRATRAASSC